MNMNDKTTSDSEKTNDPHDTRLRELFGNKEAFISFLKDCVKPDWIDDLDEISLRRSPKEYILQDFKKKSADVVYEATLKNGKEKIIFFVLQENQSKVDYRMPYRLLLYIVEILRDYYNHADENERKRKNFKFPAIFPVIFYTGRQKWTVPTNLKSIFAGYERFGEHLINFNYSLVDVKGYDEDSLKDFRSKLLKVIILFEKSQKFTEIIELAKNYKGEIRKFDEEEQRVLIGALDIFNDVYGQKYDFAEILYTKNAEGVDRMLADIVANAKNYEKTIRKEGAEAKAITMAKKMLLKNKPIDEIMEFTELTEEKIREIEEEIEI